MNLAADDREGRTRLAAFQERLQQLGWIEGRDVRLDIRWGAGDAERIRIRINCPPEITLHRLQCI
jgi:putative ABC transport system substrate-binding protein